MGAGAAVGSRLSGPTAGCVEGIPLAWEESRATRVIPVGATETATATPAGARTSAGSIGEAVTELGNCCNRAHEGEPKPGNFRLAKLGEDVLKGLAKAFGLLKFEGSKTEWVTDVVMGISEDPLWRIASLIRGPMPA